MCVLQNAFPVSGLFTTHLLSLDALLAVIDSIEQHCHHRVVHATKKHGEISTGSGTDKGAVPEGMEAHRCHMIIF